MSVDGKDQTPLDQVLVGDRVNFKDGPPHELFRRLRKECPVHWSPRITEFPDEDGFWSVVTADDVHRVSRDWETYSSELGGFTALKNSILPLELQQAMFIGMDPPKHDRIKALFQQGFTPRRIAEHEDAIREIAVDVLGRLEGREECDLVTDVAQPVVARVIGSFMGLPPEDDEVWARLMNTLLQAGDPDATPEGVQTVMERDVPEVFERCGKLIAERRETPTDDLTSVLVHAEIEGERLEDHEIVMGFVLLMAAGNDSTKATYCSGMRALMEDRDQMAMVIEDPSLVPSVVEESLRMFPAFAHFARTATRDTELNGQRIEEGEKLVMWYPSSNRDETRYEEPDRFDVGRNPEHQAFGAGGRHFCLGTALARLELRIMIEETLARFPGIEIAATPAYVESPFANQLKTLPVRLSA
jgi:cholest-4-en-3-one 26-monooxygenase